MRFGHWSPLQSARFLLDYDVNRVRHQISLREKDVGVAASGEAGWQRQVHLVESGDARRAYVGEVQVVVIHLRPCGGGVADAGSEHYEIGLAGTDVYGYRRDDTVLDCEDRLVGGRGRGYVGCRQSSWGQCE